MQSRCPPSLWGTALVLIAACSADAGENMFDPSTSGTPTGTPGEASTSTSGPASNTDPTGAETTATATAPTTETTDTGDESTSTGPVDSESSSSSGSFGSACGDGMVTGVEQCDCSGDPCTKELLDNTTCEDVSDPLVPGLITGGTLDCNPNSCRFDTTQCVYCGDGDVNGNETCETDLPIETSCMMLGKGSAGVLTCQAETCQVDTSGCTECGYMFSFEGDECPGEWITGITVQDAPASSWECGDAGANPPVGDEGGPGIGKTGVWGTQLNGVYANNESSTLQSPGLDLTNCDGETVTLTMRHWWNFEGGPSNADGGLVQASFDGMNWQTIAPSGGALYVDGVRSTYAPVDNSAAFSGRAEEEQTWVESTFDVTSYAGAANFYVRFVFGSDSGNTRAGWYIDTVTILGSGGK